MPNPILKSDERRNDKLEIASEVRDFLNSREVEHRESLKQKFALAAQRRTDEERLLKRRLAARALEKLEITEDLARLRQLTSDRVKGLSRDVLTASPLTHLPRIPTLLPPVPPSPGSPPSPGTGEMWWAQTSWSYPLGYVTMWWDDNAGLRLAANFPSTSDDLQKYWIEIHATFVLSADRMPQRDLRYASAPVSQLVGEVYGYTAGSTFIWDFGDIWSKCWLNPSQTVTILLKDGSWIPGLSAVLILTASDSRQLVFLENSNDAPLVPLPGFMGMPLVVFDLPSSAAFVVAELTWEFHVQLEGENAALLIGNTPHTPTCIINHPQWSIRTI